jgi:hypothetical protein
MEVLGITFKDSVDISLPVPAGISPQDIFALATLDLLDSTWDTIAVSARSDSFTTGRFKATHSGWFALITSSAGAEPRGQAPGNMLPPMLRIVAGPYCRTVTVFYNLPAGPDQSVRLQVLDLKGNEVEDLTAPGTRATGRLCWQPDGRVTDGVYFCRLRYKDTVVVRKFILLYRKNN